jgi:hypothetical protein
MHRITVERGRRRGQGVVATALGTDDPSAVVGGRSCRKSGRLNAGVNSVYLADPVAHPNPPVVVTLNGLDTVTRKQFRRGVNDVRLEATVGTDAW